MMKMKMVPALVALAVTLPALSAMAAPSPRATTNNYNTVRAGLTYNVVVGPNGRVVTAPARAPRVLTPVPCVSRSTSRCGA